MEQKKQVPAAKGRKFWGPPIWFTIHVLAAMLLPKNAEMYKRFLECLECLLPCNVCCGNLTKKLKKYPAEPYLKCNHDAFFYSYTLHDMVNKSKHTSPKGDEDNKPLESPEKSQSPNYDSIKSFYFRGLGLDLTSPEACRDTSIKLPAIGIDFWEGPLWFMIHTLGCTLKPENAGKFKILLESVAKILPENYGAELTRIIAIFPPDKYLFNNHDAFFYTYCIHNMMNKITNTKSQNFDDMKSFYFRGLSQECKDCTV